MSYLIFEALLSSDKAIGPINVITVTGSDLSLRITTYEDIPELDKYIDYVGFPHSYHIPHEDGIFWLYKTYISVQPASELKPTF